MHRLQAVDHVLQVTPSPNLRPPSALLLLPLLLLPLLLLCAAGRPLLAPLLLLPACYRLAARADHLACLLSTLCSL
jgi:hypothetical protein